MWGVIASKEKSHSTSACMSLGYRREKKSQLVRNLIRTRGSCFGASFPTHTLESTQTRRNSRRDRACRVKIRP